jgi:hypothetical protein
MEPNGSMLQMESASTFSRRIGANGLTGIKSNILKHQIGYRRPARRRTGATSRGPGDLAAMVIATNYSLRGARHFFVARVRQCVAGTVFENGRCHSSIEGEMK